VTSLLGYAHRAYVLGEIEVDELEAAVEHVLRGGLGNERFPYLPVSEMPQMSGKPSIWRMELRD
jgi:DNA-binding NarL/FixJ family response regulator